MKTKGFLIVVGILLMLSLIGNCLPKSEMETYKDARLKYKDKNLEKALVSINKAIQMNSTKSEYFELRGQILYEMQDTIRSNEDFVKTLKFAASDLEKDLRIREMIEWDLLNGEEDKVRQLLKKEIELYKDDSLMYVEVVEYAASTYLTLGDTHEAIVLYSMLNQKYPYSARFHNQLGVLFSIVKKNNSAIRAFEKAVHLEPDNEAYNYNLAIVFLNAKKIKKAKKHFKRAMELDHPEACKEYRELISKINYYKRSKCCDGTTSLTLGQGACSHHGGVCGIENIPYKEYTIECN